MGFSKQAQYFGFIVETWFKSHDNDDAFFSIDDYVFQVGTIEDLIDTGPCSVGQMSSKPRDCQSE